MKRNPPVSTYRVQLNGDFTFFDAAAVTPYLAELGISTIYCSPYLQAVKGSKHGYDVVDHTRVSDEIGGTSGHAQFCTALAHSGLGQVLDIVPNHMAVGGQNSWWWDVLENGPSSRYAAYFDVEWNPPDARLRNTLLVPILGDHYGRVLEAGEIRLERPGDGFQVRYHEHALPIDPRTVSVILNKAAERSGSARLAFLADAFGSLPVSTATDWRNVRRRHRDKEVLKEALATLCMEEPDVASAVDQAIADFNSDPDQLDGLLGSQNYRLAYWRTAGQELGYRRFFDINTLVGLRTEDEQVFADTHHQVLSWLAGGVLDGVRVDHPDGLHDPEEYFQRLRAAAPGAWIVGEKILQPEERLRESWPICGTTGYDFLNLVHGLFIDAEGEERLTQLYAEFTAQPTDFAALAREKKLLVLRSTLGSDINRISAQFQEVCEQHRRHRDYTRHDIREALEELTADFPVYRTYVRSGEGIVTAEDRRYITQAIDRAKAERPDLEPALFDFLSAVLLLEVRGPLESDFVMRFQQFTGPAMAKGVEDTVFYCYNRLVSLNEVGGDPGRFGSTVESFHDHCRATLEKWPHTMSTTSTHDSKRGEDVRARLALLSEMPELWEQAVWRWADQNERHRTDGMPDRNMEYLFYQTLVGAWPLATERALAYMEKASREAKMHTSWIAPNRRYEEALRRFVERVLCDDDFQADVASFLELLIEPGRINSLAQTLIKLTAPGVPDIYQGSELWDLSLVDPDNRRLVDFELRRRLLREMDALGVEQISQRMDEGLPKLWVIRQGLRLRKRLAEVFASGSYRPIPVAGEKCAHVVAFSRGDRVISIVPRLVRSRGSWGNTTVRIPEGEWRNELTAENVKGGTVRLTQLFSSFPVALLVNGE